jgi:hypothetical protein
VVWLSLEHLAQARPHFATPCNSSWSNLTGSML